jgi:predicted esterase
MLVVYRFLAIMSIVTFKGAFLGAQPYELQPISGPGGSEYAHQKVQFWDQATRADGFWLFEPSDPMPDSAEVIVFMHGYGAYNPMAYGKWIKHLVAKGNIVIYPRYQYNLLFPRPNAFPSNAAKGIKDALKLLQTSGHVQPKTEKVIYFGHSYGGVINANLGVNWKKYGIPEPAAMLLAEPGSGPFKGARLNDYSGLPEDLNLLVIVGEDDYVVGAEFGSIVFNTAVNTPKRNFVIQRRDTTSQYGVWASHSEPYAYDLDFDIGVRNYTALRVLGTSRVNFVDFYCYWKLGDALIDFTRTGQNGHIAFGNTAAQRFMGMHPDGRPVRPLDIILPDMQIKLMSRRQNSSTAFDR